MYMHVVIIGKSMHMVEIEELKINIVYKVFLLGSLAYIVRQKWQLIIQQGIVFASRPRLFHSLREFGSSISWA